MLATLLLLLILSAWLPRYTVASPLEAAVTSGDVNLVHEALAESPSPTDFAQAVVASASPEITQILLSDPPIAGPEALQETLALAVRMCRVEVVHMFTSIHHEDHVSSITAIIGPEVTNRVSTFRDDTLQDHIIQLLFNAGSQEAKTAAMTAAALTEQVSLLETMLPGMPAPTIDSVLGLYMARARPLAPVIELLLPLSSSHGKQAALEAAASLSDPQLLDILLEYPYDRNAAFQALGASRGGPLAEQCLLKLYTEDIPHDVLVASLISACRSDNKNFVRALLPKMTLTADEQLEALNTARGTRHFLIAAVLVDPSQLEVQYHGQTLLQLSLNFQHYSAAHALIQRGADFTGMKPGALLAAAHSGDMDLVSQLMNDPEVPDAAISRALVLAAGRFIPQAADRPATLLNTFTLILGHIEGLDTAATAKSDALVGAALWGFAPVLRVLLPDPDIPKWRKGLVLVDQASSGSSELVALTLSLVPALDEETLARAFTTAVSRGQLDTVQVFIQAGIVTPEMELQGFHTAIADSKYTVAAELVPVDLVDVQYAYGQTLLHIMAHSGQTRLVLRLLDLGADFRLLNDFGKSFLQVATGDDALDLSHRFRDAQGLANVVYAKVPGDVARHVLSYNVNDKVASKLVDRSTAYSVPAQTRGQAHP